jgi:hypothetical protein
VRDHARWFDDTRFLQEPEATAIFGNRWANVAPTSITTDPYMDRLAAEPLPPGWGSWYIPSANSTWINMITPGSFVPRTGTAGPQESESTGMYQANNNDIEPSQITDENTNRLLSIQRELPSFLAGLGTSSFDGLGNETASRLPRLLIPEPAYIPNSVLSSNDSPYYSAGGSIQQVNPPPVVIPRVMPTQRMLAVERPFLQFRRIVSAPSGINDGYHLVPAPSYSIPPEVTFGGSSSNVVESLQPVHLSSHRYVPIQTRPLLLTRTTRVETNGTSSSNDSFANLPHVPEHILAPRLAVVAEAIQRSIQENARDSDPVSSLFPKRRYNKRDRRTHDLVENSEVLYTKERYGRKGINAAPNAETKELDKIFFDNSHTREEIDTATIRHSEIKVLKKRAIELAKSQKNAGSNCDDVEDAPKRKRDEEEDEDKDSQGDNEGGLHEPKRVMI